MRCSTRSLVLALFALPTALALATPALATTPSAPTLVGGGTVPFTYEGARLSTDELPDSLSEETRLAIRNWETFAAEHGYRMDLAPNERVLLLSPEKRDPKRDLRLIGETLELFDDLLPVPASRPETSTENDRANMTTTWGRQAAPLETRTPVLLQAHDLQDYEAACDQIAEIDSDLQSWSQVARGNLGFVLDDPLATAYILNVNGNEEWAPENELVNRLFRVLTQRRFGRQPYWLEVGLAWHAEMKLRKGIYCFPGRDSFVGVAEHGSWDKPLKSAFKKRKDQALSLAEMHELKRGSFDSAAAYRVFGAAQFLAEHHPEALPEILEGLRLNREAGEIIEHDDGTWELVPGYEVSVEDETNLLMAHAGDRALEEMQSYFAKGKSYRPGKLKKR